MNLNGVERYHFERDGAGQELAGCSLDIRRARVATRARLTHVNDVFTELSIHYSDWDQWETCLCVRRGRNTERGRMYAEQSFDEELFADRQSVRLFPLCFHSKLGNLTFPQAPYVGLSAATGDVSDNHDVITVASNSIVYKPRTRKQIEEARRYHLGDGKDATSSKGGWFFRSGKKDKSPSSSSSGAATSDAGGHHYNGNAGRGNFLSRLFFGLFHLAWTLFKYGAVVGVVGAGVYAFYLRKKKMDAKRF